MTPAADVAAFVRSSLPSPPARVLEVGAGDGRLAALLTDAGYDVLAIDPAASAGHVVPVSLLELREADASFDAAVAVVSLHHVEPLAASCRRLADLVRPGGGLVVDEFDVERFDDVAAAWWLGQRSAAGHDHHADASATGAELRRELHPVRLLREELTPYFALGEPVRGPYLYRWDLEPGLRDAEELLIATGGLAAVGARLVGTRHPSD